MAELSRDFLINIQANGGREAAGQFDQISGSVDGAAKSLDNLNRKERSFAQTLRANIAERVRGSTTYQAINQGLNNELETLITRADTARKSLSGLENMKFTGISNGVRYLREQLQGINQAGKEVNRQLEGMSVRLTSSIKESKGLTNMGQAAKMSQEYIQMARDYAAKTPFEQTEVLSVMSALSPVFKADKKKIQNAMQAAAILAQIDPAQGFEGAAFAIREAASGDTRSLAARFELSPSQLKRHMSTNSDVGLAIQAALKENGATNEMLEMYSTTMSGIQSNMSDSRNYIAGSFNAPIYNAQKNALYSRMEQQQRLSGPGSGLERAMGALGQGASLGMTGGNLIYQSLMRPFNASRMGILDALSPGLTNARAAMQESELKLQIDDLQRRGDLNSVEKAKLKELRRQLRDLPVESRKLIRDAEKRLQETGEYISKVLGLDPKQTRDLLNRMRDFSKRFNQMVEDAKKSFTAGDIRRFIDSTLETVRRVFNSMIAIPRRFHEELKRTGMLKFLQDTFGEINQAVRELFTEVFGASKKAGEGALGVLESGKNIADLMVMALNRSRPFIAFIKNLIIDLMKVIQLGAAITGGLIEKSLGMISAGLRLMGKADEADKIDEDRKALQATLASNRQSALDSYQTGDASNATPAPVEEKKAGYNGFAAPLVQAAMDNPVAMSAIQNTLRVVGAVTGGLAAYGMYNNVKGIWNNARAGATGWQGTRLGMSALGGGALKMLEAPGSPTIRQSFGAKQLLQGRGLGANALALGLNVFAPGPISQMYGLWVGFKNIIDIALIARKWWQGKTNMTKKGWEDLKNAKFLKPVTDFIDNIRTAPAKLWERAKNFKMPKASEFMKPITDLASRFKDMAVIEKISKGIQSTAGRVSGAVGRTLKAVSSSLGKIGDFIKSFGAGAGKLFSGISARMTPMLANLLKLPVIGPILKAAGFALGSTAAAAASSGLTGWQAGQWVNKQKDLVVKGETFGESVQTGMMMQAAERKSGYMGISQEMAQLWLKEQDDKANRAYQDKLNADADRKSSIIKGARTTRHNGGFIDKTGQYTLQSGEYVLPAGGFDFQKYAKKDGGNETAQPGDIVKRLSELTTNNAAIAASARFSTAVLRLMGISPNAAGGGSGGAGGGFTPGAGGSGSTPSGGSAIPGKGTVGEEKQKRFNEVLEAARAAGDPHPEVTAAQWALESGWGKSSSGKNNFFGIKARPGQAGTLRTTKEQDASGREYTTQARFADYATPAEGVQARVDLLKSGRYMQAGYGSAKTTEEAIAALQRGGYATDTQYSSKLMGILRAAGYDPSAMAAKAPAQGNSGTGVNIKTGDISINAKTKDEAIRQFEAAQQQQAKEFRDALGVATRKN